MSYDMIDRFLRNNLNDDDYAEYSAALDELCTPPAQQEPVAGKGKELSEQLKLCARNVAFVAAGRVDMSSAAMQEMFTLIDHVCAGIDSPQPAQQRHLSELEKDAANLLFALHDAWPYVHGNCTIESKKKAIQALMVKHGDFADLLPQPAQRIWVDLTDDEIKKEFHPLHATGLQFARAVLAKSKEKNT